MKCQFCKTSECIRIERKPIPLCIKSNEIDAIGARVHPEGKRLNGSRLFLSDGTIIEVSNVSNRIIEKKGFSYKTV